MRKQGLGRDLPGWQYTHELNLYVVHGRVFKLGGAPEARLLAASPVWLQEIIVFAVNTGLQQSETLNLQWCNVDLFRGTITLLEQRTAAEIRFRQC